MCEYELIKHVTDRPHHVPGNCCLKGAQKGLSLISSWFCVGVTDVTVLMWTILTTLSSVLITVMSAAINKINCVIFHNFGCLCEVIMLCVDLKKFFLCFKN